MTELDTKSRELLARPIHGWVTTLRPDGTAHNTVVWVDVDEDGPFFNTAAGRAKDKHLRSNPTVTLSVLDPDNAFNWVSVTGTAELRTEGADADIDALAKKYLGVDTYPYRQPGEQRITVRIRPEKIVAVHQ